MRTQSRSPMRAPRGQRGSALSRLVSAMPALVAIGVIGAFIYRDRQENGARLQQQEAERSARVAAREPVFARGEFDPVFALCRDAWSAELQMSQPPVALAWTRTTLDAYFLEGIDSSSWRRLSCSATGVLRGPRVARPLLESLPAEAAPGADSAAEDPWQFALHALSRTPLGAGELAIELLPDPRTGKVISRRWRGVEGGAKPYLDPAGAPPFPALIADPGFVYAPGAAPPPLSVLPRHRWANQADAAFALIEKALPSGAGIAELTLSDDQIELSIEWPIPAFDGKPPAPYGDQEFDEYGVADRDWWYPRTDPGFGCGKGRPLADLRAEYATARARLGTSALSQAWYSCSPAYSDGHHGAWHLFPG